MVKLTFIALATASLLHVLCEGKPVQFVLPLCSPDGYLDEETINNGILNPINTERGKLAKGQQQNGDSGKNLPPATNMTKLVSYSL
ncbi:hypothetical protein ANCCAN_11011 [Ancylostoma caninum]|uniref:Transthyretin-like family protein n=1 Tax=Ancylostoma caninum TaxID=29170 RepID=A0A368GFA4_ANCCA|nr:hypothetical protein ANCCAN_11011 [Ancylostoma caninum]